MIIMLAIYISYNISTRFSLAFLFDQNSYPIKAFTSFDSENFGEVQVQLF